MRIFLDTLGPVVIALFVMGLIYLAAALVALFALMRDAWREARTGVECRAARAGMIDYSTLDPGIRSTVRLLNEAGFETTDSGDGASKPPDWYESGCAIPFPHVVATTSAAGMVADAERMAGVLGPEWTVEASYQTHTRSALLFARTLDDRERV